MGWVTLCVGCLLLAFTTITLSSAGGNVAIFLIAAIFFAISIAAYSDRMWRIIALLAFGFSIGLAVKDYRGGIDLNAKIERIRNSAAQHDGTTQVGDMGGKFGTP